MNHDLERELEKALRRHEPSHDFADRVMARIAAESAATHVAARSELSNRWQRFTALWQMPSLQWAAAGALACLLMMFATYRYREHQRIEAERFALEQAEGERAKEQVILALQIASAKLNVAQRKVRESSERNAEMR